MPNFLGIRAVRGTDPVVSLRVLDARKHISARGFTLIELVVVTAIIAVITGLILVSDSTFGGKILLENLAYDMALSIRQAQVYGISVQRFGTTFNTGYGMHFDKTSPASYIMFADAVTANGLYDCPTPGSSATCELVSLTQIDRGFAISKLCTPAGANSATCVSVNPLDITFKRPEPDACFSVNGISDYNASGSCQNTYDSARIVLKSPRGDLESLVVDSNGQITVSKQ